MLPRGFKRKANSLYWRISDHLLQSFVIERPDGLHANMGVYIQPLCTPNDEGRRYLAFGDRLGWFAGGPDYALDLTTEATLHTGLMRAAHHLRSYAIPWLDTVNSIPALVKWYRGRPWGRGPSDNGLHGRMPIWLGYCLTILGHFDDARELIEPNLQAIRQEWPDYRPTVELLALLRADPPRARAMVEDWSRRTEQALKLT